MISPEEAAKAISEWWNSLTINTVTKKERCPHCRGTGDSEIVMITIKSPKD